MLVAELQFYPSKLVAQLMKYSVVVGATGVAAGGVAREGRLGGLGWRKALWWGEPWLPSLGSGKWKWKFGTRLHTFHGQSRATVV